MLLRYTQRSKKIVVVAVKRRSSSVTLQHQTVIVFQCSHSTVSDLYFWRSMLKLFSSFIPAHRLEANSCIHLCRRTVSESDWDLKTFEMITFLFCRFISCSASLCLWLWPGLFCLSLLISISVSPPTLPPSSHLLPSSVFLFLHYPLSLVRDR